jgi:hypothetical protein
MKNTSFTLCLLLGLLFWMTPKTAIAQNDSKNQDTAVYYRIQASFGFAEGKIISEDDKELVVEKVDGSKIVFPIASVQYRMIIPNPKQIGPIVHPTRYLYAPSAIPLKRGEGYVNFIYGLAYQGQYGVTDNISIGATTSIILQPTFFNFKIGGEVDKNFYASIGGQVGKLTFADPESLSLLFANTTYGTREANITLNVGYGMYSQSREQLPIVELSGLYQSSPKVSFVFEMWALLHNDRQASFIGGPALRVNAFQKGFVDIGLLSVQFTEKYTEVDYVQNPNNPQQWDRVEIERSERNNWWPIPYLSVGMTF